MIVLRGKGEPLDVTGTQADETLAVLELEINLVTHETAQPIDLIGVIADRAQPTVVVSGCWGAELIALAWERHAAESRRHQAPHDATHQGALSLVAAAVLGGASAATSGS